MGEQPPGYRAGYQVTGDLNQSATLPTSATFALPGRHAVMANALEEEPVEITMLRDFDAHYAERVLFPSGFSALRQSNYAINYRHCRFEKFKLIPGLKQIYFEHK